MSKIDKFKFFVPVDISKAKDENGNEIMRIAGIASTIDRDSDDEILDPSGFDLSYFMKNGFINWHHQTNNSPESIIGEPTVAKITDKGLYVEGTLYNNSRMAKEVFELAKGLESSNSNRRLGFSIEGKVLERDLMDNKKITKAKITGLAITPTPKNANTIVDIIKGNINEQEDVLDTQFLGINTNGGDTYIIDITKPNGERITVDKEYNISITKSQTTANTGAIVKESVEHNTKKISDNNDKLNKNSNFVINKAQMFKGLYDIIDDFNISKSLTNKISSMNTNSIKIEQLQEVLADLGVNIDFGDLSKADKNELPENNKEVKEEPENKEETEEEGKISKTEKEVKNNKKVAEPDDEMTFTVDDNFKKQIEEYKEKVNKGEINEDDVNLDDNEDDLKKAIEEKEAELKNLKEKFANKNKKQQPEQEDVVKGMLDEFGKTQNKTLEILQQLSNRLDAIENAPVQRKSFSGVNTIEKSFGFDNVREDGKTQLSLSRDKQRISELLLSQSGIEKGEQNQLYIQAVMDFDATGSISKSVISDLFANKNILITQ